MKNIKQYIKYGKTHKNIRFKLSTKNEWVYVHNIKEIYAFILKYKNKKDNLQLQCLDCNIELFFPLYYKLLNYEISLPILISCKEYIIKKLLE